MEKSISISQVSRVGGNYQRNIKLIVAETIFTSIGAGFSVSTITDFWHSVGMNQTKIGFVQMMYTIVVLLLDLPMGYIADRFNRKLLNVIGDIGVAIAFLFYAFSNNMYMVLVAECTLGLFTAMTNGVDQSFLKITANKIDSKGEYFRKVTADMFTLKYIAMFTVIFIGGFISKISLRLAIGLSFIPYLIGGIIALGIEDYNGKAEVNTNNPIKDMITNAKILLEKPKVRLYMVCYILGKEVTHSQIWVFTPLLKMCGVPMQFTCLGWMCSHAMQIVGSKFAKKFSSCTMKKKFMYPVVIQMTWLLVLIFHTNIITVWLFALNGFVRGMADANLITPMQEETKDELQTQVMSIASTGARLLYIPVVYFVNYLGEIKLELALLGVFVVFLPLCALSYLKLTKMEE